MTLQCERLCAAVPSAVGVATGEAKQKVVATTAKEKKKKKNQRRKQSAVRPNVRAEHPVQKHTLDFYSCKFGRVCFHVVQQVSSHRIT